MDVGALAVHVEDGRRITIEARRGDVGCTLAEATRAGLHAEEVVVAPGLYASLAGREARVALLVHARDMATREVVLHVRVEDVGARAARLVVDVPRALAARLAGELGRASPLPEPGDRIAKGTFVHAFTDDEPLVRELEAAGLSLVSRDGSRFVLAAADDVGAREEEAAPLGVELARAARMLLVAERARQAASPEHAVRAMRERGRLAGRRGLVARARLRRAIGWVDAAHPSGPNCYRRTLMELALDAGAAEEPLVFGLDVGRTGHVAFKGREELGFDVLFELPPS